MYGIVCRGAIEQTLNPGKKIRQREKMGFIIKKPENLNSGRIKELWDIILSKYKGFY